MDLHLPAHYVAPAMELLLIISAMLSAVTGVLSGVRGPEPRVHQTEAAVGARVVAGVVEDQPARTIAAIPANVRPAAEVPALPTFAVASAVPLYADRLIE